MSKPILFLDFNGVLSYNKFWQQLENESHPHHHYWPELQDYVTTKNKQLFRQWMLGELTSGEVHHIIEQELHIPYEFLFPLFIEDCKMIDISEPILDKIESLKSKYYCILATANMDSLERFTMPANPKIATTFHQIDNSYHLKIYKDTNNGQYFQTTMQKLNADQSKCVLIDDSKNTCTIFTSLGGIAHNVTGVEAVLNALSSL